MYHLLIQSDLSRYTRHVNLMYLHNAMQSSSRCTYYNITHRAARARDANALRLARSLTRSRPLRIPRRRVQRVEKRNLKRRGPVHPPPLVLRRARDASVPRARGSHLVTLPAFVPEPDGRDERRDDAAEAAPRPRPLAKPRARVVSAGSDVIGQFRELKGVSWS